MNLSASGMLPRIRPVAVMLFFFSDVVSWDAWAGRHAASWDCWPDAADANCFHCAVI